MKKIISIIFITTSISCFSQDWNWELGIKNESEDQCITATVYPISMVFNKDLKYDFNKLLGQSSYDVYYNYINCVCYYYSTDAGEYLKSTVHPIVIEPGELLTFDAENFVDNVPVGKVGTLGYGIYKIIINRVGCDYQSTNSGDSPFAFTDSITIDFDAYGGS